MSNAEHYQSVFEKTGVPVNLAKAAAEVLSRQDAGELPCPLPEGSEDLHLVRSAHTWWTAKGMRIVEED